MNLPSDELHELCERAVEATLTDQQRARLEQIVLSDPAARRFYVEYMHQNACLQWSALVAPAVGEAAPAEDRPSARPAGRGRRRALILTVAAAAACAWLLARPRPLPAPRYVAILSTSHACKWDGGLLPTEDGARLPAGRMRLAEGLARFTFLDGAEVALEAPGELELVSPSRCVLHTGRLVAKVPPKAIGFTVDTPTAVLEDLGTEFGVVVRDDRSSYVQVFDGRVDGRHRASGQIAHIQQGENVHFSAADVARSDSLTEAVAPPRPAPWAETPGTTLLQISTATGRGKDAYVQPPAPPKPSPNAVLLVKHTTEEGRNYQRKAYIGLDLSPLSGFRVVTAQLSVALAPTGLGYASEVPDATFALYGLVDESLDGWDEATISWANAPANHPGGAALDMSRVVLLGRFEVLQGVLAGIREIDGPALADFLNGDTNAFATIILVRETMGSGRMDLVHGFAGKHHAELPPPTLKLMVVPR